MDCLPTKNATDSLTWLSRCLASRRKLRIENPVTWKYHAGRNLVDCLIENLACDDGIRTVTALVEAMQSGEAIQEPWVGLIQDVPYHGRIFPELNRVLELDTWRASVDQCRGLWVPSRHLKEFLSSVGVKVPISVVYSAAAPTDRTFSIERFSTKSRRQLVFVDDYIGISQSFERLEAPGYQKILLSSWVPGANRTSPPHVNVLDHISDETCDELLSDSIVFLNARDAPSDTIIAKCLLHATPVLTDRVESALEYLGDSYPFYYSSFSEAERKLQDENLIAETSVYLRDWHMRKMVTFTHFLDSIQTSAIYRDLPVPASQQEVAFRRCDLTVLICSYKRIQGLAGVLESLTKQSTATDFEVIVWNNNREKIAEVQSLTASYEGRLSIKTIHSTANFYCIVRLAVPPLMRSDLLLIIDDDVQPSSNYIQTFMSKFHQYGPRAALCARGHAFLPHRLDEEHPEETWQLGKNVLLYDENVQDCAVHFMHADNCLIPKPVLVQALQHPLIKYEFELVDDYWLSFVLSHHLKVPLWKIEASGTFTFTESANDASVAMFKNPRVKEQRVNFYVYHMRQGWPYKDSGNMGATALLGNHTKSNRQ